MIVAESGDAGRTRPLSSHAWCVERGSQTVQPASRAQRACMVSKPIRPASTEAAPLL